MKLLVLLSLLAMGLPSRAQLKSKSFRMPQTSRPSDYSTGYVLAKLKENYGYILQESVGGRSASVFPSSVGVRSTRKLINEKLLSHGKSLRGPRRSQSSVDLSLYYEISCVPGKNIEDFINELYATGYFELVEPDYVNRLLFTPNDPSVAQQYYLQTIKAYEAWDVTQGSEAVTIAIVDTGGDMAHPDLRDNLYTNLADPIDGLDNDNNGFIDDYRGWDFMGTDTLNINNPNFIGDNDPSLFLQGAITHGVSVAGCASASTNNAVGMAGVGFKSKLLITKHTADNQDPNKASIYRGYNGILYAASVGAQIINCSWGGSFRSQIAQDLITYVTFDLDAVVVASAGNDGASSLLYPAAYDNVLSVAGTNQQNVKASFSNFGSYIDLSAPAVGIFTTTYNGYTTIQGTSFSSPIVAGAVALVRAKFPTYSAQQAAEQVRISSNSSILYTANPTLTNRLGYGLLDVFQALTLSSPSIRASNPKMLNDIGTAAIPGQKAYLTFSFRNLLKATSSGLDISISSSSGFVQITKASVRPGQIPENSTITNKLTPFEMQISAVTPENTAVSLTISYKDGNYNDQETVNFLLNPSFIDVDENQITTTISSTGRIGFEDTQSQTRIKGSGFAFNQNSLLYEMGIMMGTSTTFLFNNIRGTGNAFDNDFMSTNKIKEILPGERSRSEIFGTLSNSITPATQAFLLDYRSLVWGEAPYDKFVIMEYIIKNPTALPITNFHFGLFADWDITANGGEDAAKWDNANKMGYVYPATTAAKPHAGIQLLTGTPEYYAIDNNQAITGNPFGIYDGFTDGEKIQTISSGLARLQAGLTTPAGNDVSHVVSSGPYTIPAGQEIKIAFALHAASNLAELQTSARYADSVYNFTLNAPRPVIADINACYGTPATITATGTPTYKWYKSFTGGTSFFAGPQYTTAVLLNDTSFYVSNANKTFESVRTAARVFVKANPTITRSGSPVLCSGESITLSVADADSYLWSTAATTKTIVVNSAGSYSVTVTNTNLSCLSTSAPLTVTVNPSPVSIFDISTVGELSTTIPITFINQSTNSVSWFWDFGDTQTTTLKDPTHTYLVAKDYDVKLTVNSDKGCQNTTTKKLSIITGLEYQAGDMVRLYPNPSRSEAVFVEVDNPSQNEVYLNLIGLSGQILFETSGGQGQKYVKFEVPVTRLPEGLYLVKIVADGKTMTQKLIRVR